MLKLVFYHPLRFMYLITLAIIIWHANKSQCKLKLSRTEREMGRKRSSTMWKLALTGLTALQGMTALFPSFLFVMVSSFAPGVWQVRPCRITGRRRSTKTGPQREREKRGEMEREALTTNQRLLTQKQFCLFSPSGILSKKIHLIPNLT